MTSHSGDVVRGGTMTSSAQAKVDRLNKLREDARLLELELQEEFERNDAVPSPKRLSNANTPRGKTGISATFLPRRATAAAAIHKRPLQLLKDQISANFNTIQLQFNRNDTDNTGKVDQKMIVDVMARCNIPMTQQQASEVIQFLDPDDQGRILYRDLLAIFYVQLPRSNRVSEKDRPMPFMHPSSASLPALSRMTTASIKAKSEGGRPDGLLVGIRNRPNTQTRTSLVYGGNVSSARIALTAQMYTFVVDNRHKLDEMFEMSDMDSRGRVSKFETARIFCAAGFPLQIEELEDIIDLIQESAPKGYVNYKSMLNKLAILTFDMPEIFESLTSVQFAPTHLVKVVGTRIQECYDRVLEGLAEEDTEGTGIVSRFAALRILKGLGLEISLQAMTEFLRAAGMPNTPCINLHHVIQRFVPTHRPPSVGQHAHLAERARVPKEIANAPQMRPEQLLEKLKEKMEDCIKYPREMFLKLDTDKDGALTKQELEKAFLYFNLYPKAADVDALFEMVDVHKKGRIDYGEFLQMLVPGPTHSKPSMFHDSYRSYMRKGTFYSLVPQGIAPIRLGTQGKFEPVGKLSMADIQQVIRKKLGNQHVLWQGLLLQRDPDKTGYISKELLLQVLRKLDIFITLPQLEEVISAHRVNTNGDQVEHSDFLAKFVHLGGGGKDIMAVAGRLGSQTHRPFVSEEKKVPVDRTELLNRIRAKLQGRSEDVQKAFFEEQDHALDYKVGREEVARILSRFGAPITQDQAEVLFKTTSSSSSLTYSDFVRLIDFGSRLPTASLHHKDAQVERILSTRGRTGDRLRTSMARASI